MLNSREAQASLFSYRMKIERNIVYADFGTYLLMVITIAVLAFVVWMEYTHMD